MVAFKRPRRVSVFFSDSEFDELALDADKVHREPADYLRALWLEDVARRKRVHAEKVRAWALECEHKQRELDAREAQRVAAAGRHGASGVPRPFLATVAVPPEDAQGEGSGFADTVIDGSRMGGAV